MLRWNIAHLIIVLFLFVWVGGMIFQFVGSLWAITHIIKGIWEELRSTWRKPPFSNPS